MGGHVRAVFTLVTFIFIICVSITMTSFREIPLWRLETQPEKLPDFLANENESINDNDAGGGGGDADNNDGDGDDNKSAELLNKNNTAISYGSVTNENSSMDVPVNLIKFIKY